MINTQYVYKDLFELNLFTSGIVYIHYIEGLIYKAQNT